MKFSNKGKSPDSLHDFLIQNNCKPISLIHNRKHNEDGGVMTEATEIYIGIEEEKEETLKNLVESFMAS